MIYPGRYRDLDVLVGTQSTRVRIHTSTKSTIGSGFHWTGRSTAPSSSPQRCNRFLARLRQQLRRTTSLPAPPQRASEPETKESPQCLHHSHQSTTSMIGYRCPIKASHAFPHLSREPSPLMFKFLKDSVSSRAKLLLCPTRCKHCSGFRQGGIRAAFIIVSEDVTLCDSGTLKAP